MRANEVGEAFEVRDEVVIPEPEIADGAAAAAFDLGRLDHHHAGAAGREASGVDQVPIGRITLDAGVLVHGSDDDAVLQGDVADRQGRE